MGEHSEPINAWPDLLSIPSIHHWEDLQKTERAAKQQLPLTEGETAAPSGSSDWLRCTTPEGRYWSRGDTPLESVYVQSEGEEGCSEEGDIEVGCDCDGAGGERESLIV